MSQVNVEVRLASRDYWRRFLKRAVTLLEARDARRRGRRYPFSMDGRIIFVANRHTGQNDIAILDVSAGGVVGLTREEIPIQADVRIEVAPEGTIFALQGRVVHSTPTVGGYKTGIELSFANDAEYHQSR
jgi:hypothetical protein